ncbi:hypothetical protein EDC01DRAFT_730642 [Geopyxis carbonaria]|nr:hypothetical protein EDC01DRAFT_730642 [Geopyxis carbonaria]
MSASQQPPSSQTAQPQPAPTTQPTPPELPSQPLDPAHRELLQRVINLYHTRLLDAWATVTNGRESVPSTHVSPPSIASWPRSQILTALSNFREHKNWFEWHFGTGWLWACEDDRSKWTVAFAGRLNDGEARVIDLAELVVRDETLAWLALEEELQWVKVERYNVLRPVPAWTEIGEERRRAAGGTGSNAGLSVTPVPATLPPRSGRGGIERCVCADFPGGCS